MPQAKKVIWSFVITVGFAMIMLVALPCHAAVQQHPTSLSKMDARLSVTASSQAALVVAKVLGEEQVVAWGFKKKRKESSSQRANRYRNMGAKTKTYVNKAKAGIKKGTEKAKQYYQKKKVDLKHFKEGYKR